MVPMNSPMLVSVRSSRIPIRSIRHRDGNMTTEIITDLKNLQRDQVAPPSLPQLEDVARTTFEHAVTMSRHVEKDTALDGTPHYRRFIAACLKSMSYKMFAIKRLGGTYLSEARAILRVHTEIAVDFFWLADHYRNQKEHADLLSKQFFLFHNKQFLKQFLDQGNEAEEALVQDPFLRRLVTKENLLEDIQAAREQLGEISLKGNNWRMASGITQEKDCQWNARCKRAAKVAEEMVNLKFAPFHRNLKMLSGYSHWDSIQTQEYEEELRTALFARDLNIAIGFVHDVMTGTCSIAHLEIPEAAIIARQHFIYMST